MRINIEASDRRDGADAPSDRRNRNAVGPDLPTAYVIEQQQPTRGRHTNRIFPGAYKAFP